MRLQLDNLQVRFFRRQGPVNLSIETCQGVVAPIRGGVTLQKVLEGVDRLDCVTGTGQRLDKQQQGLFVIGKQFIQTSELPDGLIDKAIFEQHLAQ